MGGWVASFRRLTFRCMQDSISCHGTSMSPKPHPSIALTRPHKTHPNKQKQVVILVLLACAAVASALVYWQRKRHENYSLLSGLDSRYGRYE